MTPLSNAGTGSCYVERKGIHDGVSSFFRECVSIRAGCGLCENGRKQGVLECNML
jgi:hypothetical protein